jgi:hypothetical protein
MEAQKIPDAELLIMRQGIEKTAQKIGELESKLNDERQALLEKVEAYAVKRAEFFKQMLSARGMTWCTHCSKIIPETDVEFLFVEGRQEYSHGYGNSFYGFRGFANLRIACSTCRQEAADRHGWKGEYSSQCNDQASYYAFKAEKREDGYYARKFGEWVKLEDEKCKLNEFPPKELVEKYAAEYGLPAKITFDYDGGFCLSDRKLVIRKLVPKTEAA